MGFWDFLFKRKKKKVTQPVVTPTPTPAPKPEPVVTQPAPHLGASTPQAPNFTELAAKVTVDPEESKRAKLKDIVMKILKNKARYLKCERMIGVSWKLIAGIHMKESSLDFNCMIHNGEPLNRKSTIVPIGVGPFATWEDSVVDSFTRQGSKKITNWSFANQLQFAEAYNGIGYRKRGIYSNYVFGYTNFSNEKGGYPRDHVWDPEYAYNKPGVAAIILALDYAEGTTQPVDTPEIPAVTPSPITDFYCPDIGAREYMMPTREQMRDVMDAMIEGRIKVRNGPYDTIRETHGKNRSPRIDDLTKRQGGSLAQPYCAYGAQEFLDEVCAWYKVPRKMVPLPEGGGTQSLWSALRDSIYRVMNPVICGWVIWYYDSSSGHIGWTLSGILGRIFKTFEFNTNSSDGDNIVRDGQGAGRCDRPVVPTGDMKLRGYIDAYAAICDGIKAYRRTLGL